MVITHYFDWFSIIIAALLVAFAAKRGFIAEIFIAAAIIGGFIGAYFSYPLVYEQLRGLQMSAQLRTLFSFFIAYALLACIILLAGWIVKKAVQITMLGWVDHALGGVIGFIKAAIVISVIVLFIRTQPSPQLKRAFGDSYVYTIFSHLPTGIRIPDAKMIREGKELLNKVSPGNVKIPAVKDLLEPVNNDTMPPSAKKTVKK